ncbi:MAG: 30S ribosomal protein S6 [Haliscomenobacter sp.]
MKNYEVTFIVDPVLSSGEISSTAQTYTDLIRNKGCQIVHVDEMGLRPLAYPINRRHSGVYFCVEFEGASGELISEMELTLRRDERVLRFLTVKLDKYGVKYNADKRSGLIGKVKKKEKVERPERPERPQRGPRRDAQPAGDAGEQRTPPAATNEAAE